MKAIISLLSCFTVLFALLLPQGQSANVKQQKQTVFRFEKSPEKAREKAKQLDLPLIYVFSNPRQDSNGRKFEKEVLGSKEWKTGIAGKAVGFYCDVGAKNKDAAKLKPSTIHEYPAYMILWPRSRSVIAQGVYNADDITSCISVVEKAYETILADREEAKKIDLVFHFEESLEKAKAIANKHHLPIMLYIYTSKSLSERPKQYDEVFNSEEWKQGVYSKIVAVRYNIAKGGEAQELAEKFHFDEGLGGYIYYLYPDGDRMFSPCFSNIERADYHVSIALSAYLRVRRKD